MQVPGEGLAQLEENGPFGGGGGGGSAVFDGTTPLAIAGGGGGGGGFGSGGNAGQNAAYPGGQAGSQTGPGLGDGSSGGSDGIGMNGGNGHAGGGGGYYGGGGGGSQTIDVAGEPFIATFGGGGGSSYPIAATEWDTSATPSVTITTSASDFFVATDSLPTATPGTPYGPVSLQAANLGTSTGPYMTTLKWKKVMLPKGLKLSRTGVLSGTPNKRLAAGPGSVTVQVTETVTTLNSKNRPVKTKTTVQGTIPLTINPPSP